jgi:two-component system sensor histidine kinase KdpD
MNVQHLESLYNTVENAVGIKVRERLPDSVLAEADQIVGVDLSTEDLRSRLQEGKIYPQQRIETALSHFFKSSNLEKLRELTLRELASQIDFRRRETSDEEKSNTPDQVMVCLSSRGPNSEKLLRYASRLAGKLNRNWYAVYVQTQAEQALVIDAQTQRLLSETLTLAKQLGAMVFTYKGEDVAETILRFAREYRVGHIILGRPGPKTFWRKIRKNKDVFGDLIRKAKGVNLILLDTVGEKPVRDEIVAEGLQETKPAQAVSEPGAKEMGPLLLSQLLSLRRIVIWDRPVQREVVISTLVVAAWNDIEAYDLQGLFSEVMRREDQGSTFYNEGVAFPHVRIDGLVHPLVALGLTRQGVSDLTTEKPIELVFLILSPAQKPNVQVQILGLASQAALNRHFLQDLKQGRNAEEVMALIQSWEMSLHK